MGKSSKRLVIMIVGGVVVVAGIVLAIFAITKPINSGTVSSSEKFDNEQVDVNGMIISEACEKVREKGWTVYAVNGMNNDDISEVTDCSDSEHRVSKAEYRPEKMFGTPRVTLMFQSDKAVETPEASGTSEEETPSAATTTPSESAPSAPSSSSSSESSVSWREVLTEYESWVDEYVEFMKKYNTASDSDKISMMTQYSTLAQKQLSWTEKLKNANDELTGADLQYYIEVTTRCAQKIAEVTK